MISRLLSSLFALVSPKCCACCGCRLGIDERVFCTSCDLAMPRRRDVDDPLNNSTARLFWGVADVERCAAWIDYEAHTKHADAIYALKYGDRPDIAFAFGKVIAAELQPTGFFDGIDCIVPLPLHPKRQRERGYNQSREFALGLCSVLQSSCVPMPYSASATPRVRLRLPMARGLLTSRVLSGWLAQRC